MKKIYKTLLTSAMCILGLSVSAQVSLYGFTQYSGTYSPISGGTVFAASTTDDGAYCNPGAPTTAGATGPGIPIGFPFTFNFITYDVFGIDNNGWIAFGQSTLTPNPVNLNNSNLGQGISGTSTAPGVLQNRVAAFGRDMVSNGGTLRVQTVGTAPNRECVIQWANYKVYLGSDNLYFQIRLKETTNVVDVIYGTSTITAVTGAQVGIRGNSPADFSNRNVTSPNVWATSVPGTVNTDVCNINTTVLFPANGQVYEWTPPPPCNGPPSSNTVNSTFTMVCPGGTNTLNLASTYTNTGITYQWYVSNASAVGPYTLVTGATAPVYTPTNITVTSWYMPVVTCSVGPVSTSVTAYNLLIAGTTTNTVPYYEGFEGITVNNQLPNCSWSASNLPTINQTYTTAAANNRVPHTGLKFASFRQGTNASGDYFYSNGVEMHPGITYSAAVWYITDGLLGWSDLSILYGTTQTTTGLTPIVSQTGAVSGQFYQLLSNTFTVPTSGLYYVAIKAIGNSTPQFLTFDDLSITIPCSLNSPSLSVITTPSVPCAGEEVSALASGGDMYSWSTGDQTAAMTFTPFATMNLSVVATNSLSGCSSTLTQLLMVNTSPVISVFSNQSAVCAGSTATLNAFGAITYTWSSGSNAQTTTVIPTFPLSSYTVSGSNANGCIGMAMYAVGVNTLPIVSASSSAPNDLCVGETATLTGSGALNYQWKNNSIIIITQQAYVSPSASTIYTLTGTDANGCSNTTQAIVSVSECVGLKEATSGLAGIKLYPNPSSADFTIELNNGLNKRIELLDLTGRVVLNSTSSDDKINVNVTDLAAGIYYVRISSGNASQVIKVIKN